MNPEQSRRFLQLEQRRHQQQQALMNELRLAGQRGDSVATQRIAAEIREHAHLHALACSCCRWSPHWVQFTCDDVRILKTFRISGE